MHQRTGLRIFALPLSVARSPPLFCFLPHSRRIPAPLPSSDPANPQFPRPPQRTPYLTRIIDWSARKWDELRTSDKDTWKYKTWRYGERLMDRIDYEEWCLKTIDPSSSPKPFIQSQPNASQDKPPPSATPSSEKIGTDNSNLRQAQQHHQQQIIPLYYPTSTVDHDTVLACLTQMLSQRTPLHRRGLFTSIFIMPFTIPLMIFPIIPNLPFYFLAWRAWSHWKAWRSSTYLQTLLSCQCLVPTPSAFLDNAYFLSPPTYHKADSELSSDSDSSKESSSSSSSESETSHLLMNSQRADKICKDFELSERYKSELSRAVVQTKSRLSKLEKS